MLEAIRRNNVNLAAEDVSAEFLRKGIHLLIAAVPLIASISFRFATTLLWMGIVVFALAEMLRLEGKDVPFISKITRIVARRGGSRKFIVAPITLALGALFSLYLFPEPVAALAIYALAFGDGFAGLIGKMYGRIKIPFSGGKTLIGSTACFTAVFLISMFLLKQPFHALTIASMATLLEALPLKDFDNFVIPTGLGFFATQLLMFN